MGGYAHRPCRPCHPERRARGLCHPERRARSARSLVILSGGRGAPGVEGSHWSRMPAAKVALPGREAPDARPVRAVGRRRTGACGAGGGRGRGRLSACGAGSRQDLWPEEKRQSRADGQVCPSTLLSMVCPPAGSPYETSTNRWGGRVDVPARPRPARGLQLRRVCSDWCRFRAAGRGSDACSTCGRLRPALARTPRRSWSRNPFREGSGHA